ncbi:MAG: FUSC family protein [Candidatus Dactylopiibacterium sp.]|nr:FUSC family protein [Candidatus Dactylopiibacterium sp.]
MSTSALPWFALDRAGLLHALRLSGAALLAFAIASMLHVQNAYWAAMPIWVVAQPSRGLLLERAFHRVVGTALGALLGFAILHAAAPPGVQIAALACVVALGAGLTHILRGVLAYGALMTGMTATVVVLPALVSPEAGAGLAVARVECTMIGVVVVTLVTGLATQASRRDARVRTLAADAVAFAALAARGHEDAATAQGERRVLAEMSDVDALASMVSAGSVEGYRRLRHVDALILAALAVMAAGRAVRARAARGEAVPAGLIAALEAFATPLREGARTPSEPSWTSANPEQERLAQALRQLQDAEARLFAGPAAADARSFSRKAAYLAPHRDWALARSTGGVAGLACLVASTLAWKSGHPAAELTALGVCIFSMVLGSLPVPQRAAPMMMAGVLTGVVAATFYRFCVQPHAFEGLALVAGIAPFLLLGGLMRANPRTSLPGLDANMCFLLASQAGMAPANAAHILTGGAALLAGAALVAGGFVLLPRRFDRQAREVARHLRADLHRLTRDAAPERLTRWHPHGGRLVLRLMLHLSRLGGRLGGEAPDGLLATQNLARAVMTLRDAATGDTADARAARQALRALAEGVSAPAGTAARLDEAARALPAGSAVRRAMENAADCLLASLPVFAFAEGAA